MIGGYANFHLFTSDSAARARSSSMSNSGLCTHWAKRESRIFRGYTSGPFHPCPHWGTASGQGQFESTVAPGSGGNL